MKIGSDDITKIYHGSSEVTKVYKGVTEIWSGGASDPIQDLVDEYKAYVNSQGGTFGVTDSDLYDEYTALVADGKITNTGVNTKSVIKFGLYGYKLSGDTHTHIYGLTKIGGNYTVHEPLAIINGMKYATTYWNCNLDGTKIGTAKLQTAFAKNSYYIEITAKLLYGNAHTLFLKGTTSSTSAALTLRASNLLRTITYGDTTVSTDTPVNLFTNEFATYKLVFTRTGDNCVLTVYKNGSLFHTSASFNYTAEENYEMYYYQATAAGMTNHLQKFETGLI